MLGIMLFIIAVLPILPDLAAFPDFFLAFSS
jgi:hypothetical protein